MPQHYTINLVSFLIINLATNSLADEFILIFSCQMKKVNEKHNSYLLKLTLIKFNVYTDIMSTRVQTECHSFQRQDWVSSKIVEETRRIGLH